MPRDGLVAAYLYVISRACQDMTTALLHAHRCTLKDEPVPVPIPLNTIPDLIVPSHIIVQRCSGEFYPLDLKPYRQQELVQFLQSITCRVKSRKSVYICIALR